MWIGREDIGGHSFCSSSSALDPKGFEWLRHQAGSATRLDGEHLIRQGYTISIVCPEAKLPLLAIASPQWVHETYGFFRGRGGSHLRHHALQMRLGQGHTSIVRGVPDIVFFLVFVIAQMETAEAFEWHAPQGAQPLLDRADPPGQ